MKRVSTMSANVEFNITAFDRASNVFSQVSSSANEFFTTVTTNASEAASEVNATNSQVSPSLGNVQTAYEEAAAQQDEVNAQYDRTTDAVKRSAGNFQSTALAANNLGTGAMGLYNAFDNVERATVSLDRAHVSKATIRRI